MTDSTKALVERLRVIARNKGGTTGDEINEIADALQDGGWQPIESAPLREAVIVHHAAHWTRLACKMESGDWMQWPGPVRGELLAYVPTHWQPLPSQPAPTTAAGDLP